MSSATSMSCAKSLSMPAGMYMRECWTSDPNRMRINFLEVKKLYGGYPITHRYHSETCLQCTSPIKKRNNATESAHANNQTVFSLTQRNAGPWYRCCQHWHSQQASGQTSWWLGMLVAMTSRSAHVHPLNTLQPLLPTDP